jgi:hypothetical protein
VTGVRSWMARLGGAAALATAACAGSGGDAAGDAAGDAGDDPPIEPVDVVGETDQGLRLRIDAVAPGEVRLRFPAVCGDDGPGDGMVVRVHHHPFVVPVDGDGAFAVDESYVESGTDGDEDHVDVRIEGDFERDGTAAGTLEVTLRPWSGERDEFGTDCETGVVHWEADGPPVEGNPLVVPLAPPSEVTNAGPDLLARVGGGELVRIVAATGEVRPLGGTPPAAADAGSAGSAPPTVGTGPGGLGVAPSWMTNFAVVGDGVWAVDPATGALSRFDLAGGVPTATIQTFLDSMAAGPDALWTVSTNWPRDAYTLDRRDPVTGTVVASVPVERGQIIPGPTDVWYADPTWEGTRLQRVDPATATLSSPIDAAELPLRETTVVASADRVWWLDDDGDLRAIDLTTGRHDRVELPSAADSLAADPTGVWTYHDQEAVLRRVEGGQVVRTVDAPDGQGGGVAVSADGAVWLAGGSDGSGRVVRLDPAVTGGRPR